MKKQKELEIIIMAHDEKDYHKMAIPIPKDSNIEGKSGDEIEVLIKGRIDNGYIIPTSVDGTPIDGGDKEYENEEAAEEKEVGKEEEMNEPGAEGEPEEGSDFVAAVMNPRQVK